MQNRLPVHHCQEIKNRQMKYKNDLQKEIVEYLLRDERFHYIGYTGTHWITTYEKGDKYEGSYIEVDEHRLHSGKGLAKVRFLVFSQDDSPLQNMKIELSLNSYCEWDTFFEGWVDSLDELKLIMKCLGLGRDVRS